jgi:hypothetical protein
LSFLETKAIEKWLQQEWLRTQTNKIAARCQTLLFSVSLWAQVKSECFSAKAV